MLQELREKLLEKSELLDETWMKKYIEQVHFCMVDKSQMTSIGGSNEQIACIGNTCYVTPVYLSYHKSIQRIFFLVEFINMFSYLGANPKWLSETENLTNTEFLNLISSGVPPLLEEYEYNQLGTLEHSYIRKDTKEASEHHLMLFPSKLGTICNILTKLKNKNTWEFPINAKLDNNRLTLDLDVSDEPLLKKVCLHNILPRPTSQKASLVMEDFVVNQNNLFGELSIVLDTPEICVLKKTGIRLLVFTNSAGGTSIAAHTYTFDALYYYHYTTKRFIGEKTSAYKTFQKNYGAILELQVAHDNN